MTTPIAANKIADTDRAWMYYLKFTPYLPHYTEKGVYVGPNGDKCKEIELVALGAVKKETCLWPRPWQKDKLKSR